MKIAVMNEFSQSAKNDIIVNTLKEVVEPMGHEVVNTGMTTAEAPLQYGEPNYLTYLNLGVQAALLLNSGAVDFVVTGCGTGQGALMALNSFPGVVCGYCIEPTDAYLFLQINNGNALSIPYAKGFGWGAELNLQNIFTRAFGSPKGMGYPNEPGRKESQNRNAAALDAMKKATNKPLIEGLKSIDPYILKTSLTPRFLEVFNAGCKCDELKEFVASVVTE